MKGNNESNKKPKRENSGNEPKNWSDDPGSAKYHSRSAEYKAKEDNKK